ncbi:MAG: bifunctional precorrin-2 dehydrogenase/sirohydrochlorin ferrochelatase [Phycisphaerae bacterium]|jgi:precorrin-2 dehydrogenase/sirohydrochlorin ferrochelatase
MKYPIFLNLKSKRAVVIGGGAVAARKVLGLLQAQARVVVVAENIDDTLETRCKSTNTEFVEAKYSKDYLVGATIVFAATNSRKLNEQIYNDCQQLEIFCNVADDPELCDFFVPAVVRRDDLQIAICTEGDFPAYAGHIRKKLEDIFTEKHGEFLTELESIRKYVMETMPDSARRKALLGELAGDTSFEYFTDNGPAGWRNNAEEMIKSHTVKAQ